MASFLQPGYSIAGLGHFVGPSPQRVDRIDDRELKKVLRRWRTAPEGQSLDLGAIASNVNPWTEGRPRAIDSFAGMGGFSVGASMADIDVIWSVNHWKEAVAVYKDNHPWIGENARCENIAVPSWDWRQAPHHQIHIASPSCKGHTKARGAYGEKDQELKKLYDALRGTARAVLEAAEYHLPDVIVIENVPEFRNWGARQADGRLYKAWVNTLEAMDYTVTEQILNAADSGAACSRERLFIVARQGGEGIEIPRDNKPWQPVGPLIDWTDREQRQGRWYPLNAADRRKFRKAPLEKWVTDLVDRGRRAGMGRGIIPYFGASKDKLLPLSIHEPLGSPGTKSTFAVYDLTSREARYRFVRPEELKLAMGFPQSFRLPTKRNGRVHVTQANTMLANGVCPPCAAHLFTHVRRQMELTG